MKTAKLSKRFFASTRGRIVTLLRGHHSTVNQLAEELDLTDNAIRAHLATLERDGLVKQSGLRKGSRKPHFAYELTEEAEHLFPKAYDTLLNQFISVLKARLTPKAFADALHAVGRALAAEQGPVKKSQALEKRARRVMQVLETLGGNPRLERTEEGVAITSSSCPLAAVVSEHPETCQMVQTLVSELLKTPVREQCDRSNSPRCSFVVSTPRV